MNDDASYIESDEPMSEDSAAEEPEEALAQSAPEAADEGGEDGGDTQMLGPIEIPSTGRLLVGIGGAAMALSTLFSWVEVGADSYPNISGVGVSTGGIGLAVFLAGLSLMLQSKSVGVTLGIALGAFSITLIWIVLVGTDSKWLGFGAWIGLVGSALAVLGALHSAFRMDEGPSLEIQPMPAAIGAVLAVVASFLLDWELYYGQYLYRGSDEAGPFNGFDSEVLSGLPVLILGGIALVLVVELMSAPRAVIERRKEFLVLISQTAGIAIAVIAGSRVLGSALVGYESFGSGPLVALVGGIMITRSIKQA